MAWIESHQSLDNHPKLMKACKELMISRPQMIGHLHLLWHWCLDYAINGDLSKYSSLQIAKASGFDEDSEMFVNVLFRCNFLDRKRGVYAIHDWLDFCGDLVKKRLEYIQRKRERSGRILGESQRKTENSQHTVPYRTKPITSIAHTTKFIPPTAAEAEAYAKELGFQLNGEAFISHYAAGGWMRGKTKNKNWKACVLTWKRTAKERETVAAGGPSWMNQ